MQKPINAVQILCIYWSFGVFLKPAGASKLKKEIFSFFFCMYIFKLLSSNWLWELSFQIIFAMNVKIFIERTILYVLS
jgi:hypothetical protein